MDVIKTKTRTPADGMRFTQGTERFLSIEMAPAHFFLVRKRGKKEGWRRLAGQREVG